MFTEILQLVYSILSDSQKQRFEEQPSWIFPSGIKNRTVPRQHLLSERSGRRSFPFHSLRNQGDFKDLGVPQIIDKRASSGIGSVTGPASGKSTTLAAMLDSVNAERSEHIIDRGSEEYLHSHKKCIVNQREVHIRYQVVQQGIAGGVAARSWMSPWEK
ncbi:MAG: hypothetical protein MZV49_04830 [Rhodopseudomonas palustris]|nr:hypothetical protein [Rhodopseudomonas palustris]